MFRLIRYGALAVIMIVVVFLALANRETVVLHLLPEELSRIYSRSFELPLFVVILASVLLGLILGYGLEYLREYKHRKRAAESTRAVRKLQGEVRGLKKKTGRSDDDVLALLG
ncbi:MAG: lipopolysaccharide assembly protein LapA domain-containing protein [Paracoccaceae bacterium]